jgi:PilZ domain-containing protein
MSTDPNRLERRSAQRFEVHQSLSLAIHFEGRTVPGFIQNLSARGIFFYAGTTLPEGAVVELTFTMASEITLAESMPVRCRGRVLRASPSPTGRVPASLSQAGQRNGIAVRLESYQYLPADEPISQFVRVSAASAGAAVSGPASR